MLFLISDIMGDIVYAYREFYFMYVIYFDRSHGKCMNDIITLPGRIIDIYSTE